MDGAKDQTKIDKENKAQDTFITIIQQGLRHPAIAHVSLS